MKHPAGPRPDNSKATRRAALMFTLLSMAAPQALGQAQQELLFFTSIGALEKDSDNHPEIEDSSVTPAIDALYSYSDGKFRFLAEYFWSSDEHELERLHVGWQYNDNTQVTLGRVHSPANFWAAEYHHGGYLQTSITRPSVDAWEDESGPIPSHLTGLSLEQEFALSGEASIGHALSGGIGPRLDDRELVAFDLLDPDGGHDPAFNYRITYKPNVLSLNQFGLTSTWSDINVESDSHPSLNDIDDIRQYTVGIFADWGWRDWRVLGNLIYFNNDIRYLAEKQDDDFVSGYIQAEFRASKNWTVFARSENSFGEGGSPYLSLLKEFIANKYMLGVRWDFTESQSLTVEIADASELRHDGSKADFQEARIQWSAVFP